jgi:hypothetical protein
MRRAGSPELLARRKAVPSSKSSASPDFVKPRSSAPRETQERRAHTCSPQRSRPDGSLEQSGRKSRRTAPRGGELIAPLTFSRDAAGRASDSLRELSIDSWLTARAFSIVQLPMNGRQRPPFHRGLSGVSRAEGRLAGSGRTQYGFSSPWFGVVRCSGAAE